MRRFKTVFVNMSEVIRSISNQHMKEIIDKLSSYNIFNYLLPGVLFVAIAKNFTEYNLILDNDFIGAFFYYFIGMVISRFGSLIIERSGIGGTSPRSSAKALR